MRIGAEPLLGLRNTDLRQKLDDARAGSLSAETAMERQDLAHLPLDGMQRIERGHRLLKDDRDAIPADTLEILLGRLEQILPLEEDLARGMRRGRIGQQPQD